ncbi:MAG TPA: protein kinase [Thermoanaerobaculia bacterium]
MSDPATIGPYQVLRRLGAGGMGEVFLAHDPRLERRVAIKRIRSESGSDPARRARFLREARVAASLSHPALVQVFDLLEEDGADNIVMEYVAGSTLFELLRRGPLPLAEGLRIAVAVADGLAYAHRQGVLHRDLKTENVLLTPEGEAKIADFGIARRLFAGDGESGTLTQAGAVLGTPRAMSPEQVCGDPLDARSDLFSLGVLLYEVFGGRSPFQAVSGTETVRRILQHRPPALAGAIPGVPPDLSELVEDLLEKDPDLRPRDAQEVAGRLRVIAAGLPAGETTLAPSAVPALPVQAPPATTVTGPGRRWLWRGALAAGGLVLAGTSAFHLLSLSDPGRPLHVAVLAPRLQTGTPDEETAFLAFALRGAIRSGLTSLEEVFPRSEGEVDAVTGTPVQVARALAVDEVIETGFACRGRSCSVELTRLRGEDGAATWSGRIEVPIDSPYTVAQAVAVLLNQGYPDSKPRPGVSALRVSPEDYSEYLSVRRALSGGGRAPDLMKRLAALRGRSPEFVDAYLLEASVETNLYFSSSRDPALLDRALWLLTRAQTLAPGNPEVHFTRAYTEIRAGRLAEAEATLAAFERSAPADVRVLDLRALLAERRGRPEEALVSYRRAVELQPSWGRLYELANLAWRQGDAATARKSLETLLDRYPENDLGRQLLAAIELTEGDPRRAAGLYEEVVARRPEPGALVNLGLARMLMGDYAGAAEAMAEAHDRVPGNYFYLLNLAQVLWLQGRGEEAGAMFRRVLALSDADPARDDWQRLTVRAQALAHLGRRQEAVAAAQEALRLAPRSGQVAFEAALVFALVGDRTAALVNARRAHQLGFDGAAWFRLPWFETLAAEPDFRRLIASRP